MVLTKKIVFRADAGPEIGMGHFFRSLALAEMLNEDFYCVFATQNPTLSQINEINKVCKEYIVLPDDENHFNSFLGKLTGNEIVVLDNYYFTTSYQKKIKEKGCKLICIDDIHDKHFVSDGVINHAEGVVTADYSKEDYTKLFLGFKYSLIRSSFLKPVHTKLNKEYSCLIIIGGTDPGNHTIKIIEILDPKILIAAVVSSDYCKLEDLKQFKNVSIFQNISSEKVLDLMNNSLFGIFPASTIAIEACSARLPFICGYYVDNQKELYKGIKENELAICIGDYNKLDRGELINAISDINNSNALKSIIERQNRCLDKKSKERFLEIFHSL